MEQSSKLIGFSAAIFVTCLWAGWTVASRVGASSPLTVYDLIAIRLATAGAISLPLLWYFKTWQTLSLKRGLVLCMAGGPVYVWFAFSGFKLAPAAHGGVFINGVMPVFALLLGVLFLRDMPRRVQVVAGLTILIASAVIATGSGDFRVDYLKGDLLYLAAGALFSVYMMLCKRWQVGSMQIVYSISFLGACTYLPIYFSLLPSNFEQASQADIGLQVLYQGILPSYFGMLSVGLGVKHIGTTATSAVMSGVPALAGILGWWLLSESLSLAQMIAMAVLTIAILVMILPSRRKVAIATQ
ncbi:MAG: DMT family transporter [Gammaproteobacteria bacterium]|nr:DMT family transporter [Gammaproteobacteria bacterium]